MNLPSRVHRLSSRLANQIAAGEVVERPASVLKELLENSLDAGATQIRVDIEGGGSQLIRVQDDGCGIHRDDLGLALSRHATSKIEQLADLERLASMGFRGEALASIASVSRCRLVSRQAGEESGWLIEVAGSEQHTEVLPQAHPQGTTIEVRDLFFNTPARRRFLRSERTEQGHLEEVFKRIALSRFDVAFMLRCGQRMLYRLHAVKAPEEQEHRLRQLCGKSFLRHAFYADFETSGLRLKGWLATPDFARSQTDLQYFYLNGRIIRDRLVNHAIRQAYQERLYPGRHPAFVLYLEMAPGQVDVNVHPTKHEVRFREARLVHDFLVSTLQQALEEGGVKDGSPSPAQDWNPSSAGRESSVGKAGRERIPPQPAATFQVSEQIAAYRRLHEVAETESAEEKGISAPAGHAMALLHGRYLLALYGTLPRLLDLRRGREVLFRKRLQEGWKSKIPSRPLLLPVQLALDSGQMDAMERYADRLQRAGFEMSGTGPEGVMVRQMPRMFHECEVERFIPALLSVLNREPPVDDARFLSVLARQAAEAVSRESPLDELQRLLQQLDSLPDGLRQGIGVTLEAGDLERLFPPG